VVADALRRTPRARAASWLLVKLVRARHRRVRHIRYPRASCNQVGVPSELPASGEKERNVRSAAVVLPLRGYGATARRLSAHRSSADNPAWDALMVAAQGGDASSYHRLLSEAAAWLRRYYARRLPPAMIDDAIQETLIAIHQKRHTYVPTRPFAAWLAAIARYKWIDALRSLKTKPTEPLDEHIPAPDHEAAVTSAWSLERLLATLKPAQSHVIRLVKLQGLSIEEASEATGQSATLVKVNIHRGLKRLTSLLRSESDAD
jgi:RNA polymerase sigma factor (sigma-70 family)